MKNRFEKYAMYERRKGKIINVNPVSLDIEMLDDSFLLFKDLYNTDYGTIEENANLISIHTGGWSDNEQLISEFMETGWWFKYHCITARGGHYYFNTEPHAEKEWQII